MWMWQLNGMMLTAWPKLKSVTNGLWATCCWQTQPAIPWNIRLGIHLLNAYSVYCIDIYNWLPILDRLCSESSSRFSLLVETWTRRWESVAKCRSVGHAFVSEHHVAWKWLHKTMFIDGVVELFTSILTSNPIFGGAHKTAPNSFKFNVQKVISQQKKCNVCTDLVKRIKFHQP